MTWIIHQTLFCQNVEIENSPNINNVKVSQYTVVSYSAFKYVNEWLLKMNHFSNYRNTIHNNITVKSLALQVATMATP